MKCIRFLTDPSAPLAPTKLCPMRSLAFGQTIFSLPPVNFGRVVLCEGDNTVVIETVLKTYRCVIC